MSFAENAKKILTETTENVVKASSEFIETSKIKYRIYDSKIDLKRLFEKLGRISYAEFCEDVDMSEEKEEIYLKISELEKYIEELNEKLSR